MKDIHDLKILLVDDEAALCEMVEDVLTRAGFRSVQTAQSCAEAERQFAVFAPDGILLDVMLPDGDGFALMQRIRQKRDLPILFLSARDADADRLHGLGLGADDYISKPFLPQELVLRLTAVLRRAYAPILSPKTEQLRLGNAVVDWRSGTITRDGKAVSLTAKEYAILRKLSENRGHIITIDALCYAAWGEENFGYENTLMVHIRRLRAKIEEQPSKPRWLLTVRGLGYKLAQEEGE